MTVSKYSSILCLLNNLATASCLFINLSRGRWINRVVGCVNFLTFTQNEDVSFGIK